MIINCENCYKNFEVDSALIPDNGRLLQCSACDHKWFYKISKFSDLEDLITDFLVFGLRTIPAVSKTLS